MPDLRSSRYSMGLDDMFTFTPETTPQGRSIWQSGVPGGESLESSTCTFVRPCWAKSYSVCLLFAFEIVEIYSVQVVLG